MIRGCAGAFVFLVLVCSRVTADQPEGWLQKRDSCIEMPKAGSVRLNAAQAESISKSFKQQAESAGRAYLTALPSEGVALIIESLEEDASGGGVVYENQIDSSGRIIISSKTIYRVDCSVAGVL